MKGVKFSAGHSHGGHSHGGHSHGGHSHGGHSHGGHSHAEHSHGGHSHGGHSHGELPDGGGHAHGGAPRARRPDLPRGAGRGELLFFDTFSGVAGDMTLSALVDLGVPPQVIRGAVDALGLSGVELHFHEVAVGAIGATHLDVRVEGAQPQRAYHEIRALIDGAALDDDVRELAQRIFLRLAEAESEVHRIDLGDVQFHEVGAVDALVDIVGAAAAITYLGAEVVSTPLPMGRGFVNCQHGVLPLPAPATVLCLRGVPTVEAPLEAELVTPTGAAIVATVARRFTRWPSFQPRAVGWGAGTRRLPDRPNALRVVLGRPNPEAPDEAAGTHVVLEANLDDVTGELTGHAIARLLELGALDAWAVPTTMKKGRPGLVLTVLGHAKDAGRLAESILLETPTLGVRQSLVSRVELPRTSIELETPWGPVRAKVSGDPPLRVKPEFDACAALAREHGVPLQQVLGTANRLADEWLERARSG